MDTDGDGIQDGTEVGRTEGGPGTAPGTFVPDADPTTTTDPLNADTDGDGMSDGAEDTNRDGSFGDGESDPLLGADGEPVEVGQITGSAPLGCTAAPGRDGLPYGGC